jgi:hypothetical protein
MIGTCLEHVWNMFGTGVWTGFTGCGIFGVGWGPIACWLKVSFSKHSRERDMPSAPKPITEDELLDAFLMGWPEEINNYAKDQRIAHWQAAEELIEGYILLQKGRIRGIHTEEIVKLCYTLRQQHRPGGRPTSTRVQEHQTASTGDASTAEGSNIDEQTAPSDNEAQHG